MASVEKRPDMDDAEKSPSPSATKEDRANNDAGIEWTFTRIIAIASLCIAYVGSQIILYFAGGALTYIAADIGTVSQNWLLTANTLAVTAICPFVGYLTDLLGRRWICIFGNLLLVIASIVMAKTESFGSSVTAMAIGGIGAGICELVALAGVAEITPVRWRGVTLSIVTFSILPFIPYLIYVQELETKAGTWRWIFLIVALWNFLSFIGLIFAYHPPPRHNVDGLSRMDILKRIDYVGAFLSIVGVTLLLVGLQAGNYPWPWTSARVLAPLIIGLLMIIAFPIWEWKGPAYPMVPWAIFRGQWVVGIAYGVVFVAGMNFYSVLGFFPIMLQALYASDPIEIGIRALGYPLAILGGACIFNALLSYTRGHVREMFTINAAIMTAFGGALAASTPFNPGYAVAMATIDSFGIGAVLVPALTLALYACPDEYIGTTTALSLAVRFLGGSVGTTIFFNIFNTQISDKLPAYVAAAAVGAGASQDTAIQLVMAFAKPYGVEEAVAQVPGITPQMVADSALATRWAYADSLKYVWLATIPFGVISMIICAMLPSIRKYLVNRVAVDIH